MVLGGTMFGVESYNSSQRFTFEFRNYVWKNNVLSISVLMVLKIYSKMIDMRSP